jgi:RES domain
MPSFKGVYDYQEFVAAVQQKRRFIQTEAIANFLQCISAGSKAREGKLSAGRLLSRAQIGSREWSGTDEEGRTWAEDVPYGPDRMKPAPLNPSEGRANPRGIPYLYLATDNETAIAEVRPWSGALVSVGVFETKRDLRLVDCTRNHGKAGSREYRLGLLMGEFDKLSPTQIDEAVWTDIDTAFSLPVGAGDEFVNYIPTQIIAEQFLADGFDGIAYKSALSERGSNVVLFKLADAGLQSSQLFRVSGMKYEFENASSRWFMKGDEFVTMVITDVRPISSTNGEDDNRC